MSFISLLACQGDPYEVARQVGIRIIEIEGASFDVAAGHGIVFMRSHDSAAVRASFAWQGLAMCLLESAGSRVGEAAVSEVATRLAKASGRTG